jgi:hypothetical protein
MHVNLSSAVVSYSRISASFQAIAGTYPVPYHSYSMPRNYAAAVARQWLITKKISQQQICVFRTVHAVVLYAEEANEEPLGELYVK